MVDVVVLVSLLFALQASLVGDAAFDDGLRLYKQTEYEQAVVQFESVAGRPGLGDADRAEALLWVGLSQAGAGEVELAAKTFRAAVEADPAVVVPPQTSPALVAQIERLRAEAIAARAPATLASPPAETGPSPPASSNGFALGVGGLAVGGVAVVAGGVLAAVASGALATANDPEQFQVDARAALDTANASAVGAGVLLPLGLAAGIAGGVLLATSLE